MRMASRVLRCTLLIGCLALVACDDEDDGGTGPGDDVYGLWELDEAETVYLHIEADRIRVYDDEPANDCYDVAVLEIVDREGAVFTLNDGAEEILAEITRVGAGLVIDSEGDVGSYSWADIDPELLPAC